MDMSSCSMYILSFLRDCSRAGVRVERFPVRKAAVQAILLGVMLGVLLVVDGGETVASSAAAVDMREREVAEAWDTKDERESWVRLS